MPDLTQVAATYGTKFILPFGSIVLVSGAGLFWHGTEGRFSRIRIRAQAQTIGPCRFDVDCEILATSATEYRIVNLSRVEQSDLDAISTLPIGTQATLVDGDTWVKKYWSASGWSSESSAGPSGEDGSDGQSAYQIAVAGGFVGNSSAWLASLVGATGSPGADGADGIDGSAGAALFKAANANFQLTTDQAFSKIGSFTNYRITGIVAKRVSGGATVACAGGIYTGANTSGTTLVDAAQVWLALSGSGKIVSPTLAGVADTDFSTATPILSLSVGSTAALTADVYIFGQVLD